MKRQKKFSGLLERRRNKGKQEANGFSYERDPFRDIELEEDEQAEEMQEEIQAKVLENPLEEEVIGEIQKEILEEDSFDLHEDIEDDKIAQVEEQEEIRTYVPSRLKERRNEYRREVEKRISAYETDIRKKLYIEFIMDKTISFTTVFPKVFYIMETMMKELKYKKTEYRDVEIQYGLTLFNEDVEIKTFSNREYFTRSEDEFLQALRNIRFSGGSDNGKEDLTGAITEGMRVLQNAGEENAERGLFFFSDSMPMDDDMFPDFTDEEQDGYWNKGVRFAEFYTYTDEFEPMIWMVNGEGVNDGEGKNLARMYSLQTLLNGDLDEASKRVENTVRRILNQCSVSKNR